MQAEYKIDLKWIFLSTLHYFIFAFNSSAFSLFSPYDAAIPICEVALSVYYSYSSTSNITLSVATTFL